MKIVAFVSEYPRVHGGQRSFLQLLRALGPKGVTPIVVMPGEGRATEVYREAGLDVRVLPGRGVLTEFGTGLIRRSVSDHARAMARDVLPYGRSLVRLIERENADLLHCMTVRSTLAAGIVPRLAGIPVVGHMRGMLTPYSTAQRSLFAMTSTRVVSVAGAIVSDLPSWARSRCTVVHNAIDETSVAGAAEGPALRASLGLGDDDVAIVIVGSVSPEKGHHQLLEALSLVETSRRVVVLVVGSAANPAYERWLRRRAAELARFEVRFIDWTSNPHAYHVASDLLVLPSVTRDRVVTDEGVFEASSAEGLPRTILEAMYLGRPVVAYDMAGVREQVVDGVTGLLVEESDVVRLASALSTLIEDAPLRRRMGAAAALRCRAEFGSDKMVDGILDVYRALVA